MEIGEKLIFLDSYLDIENKSQPYAWQVKFECKDGYISDAAHLILLQRMNGKHSKSIFVITLLRKCNLYEVKRN